MCGDTPAPAAIRRTRTARRRLTRMDGYRRAYLEGLYCVDPRAPGLFHLTLDSTANTRFQATITQTAGTTTLVVTCRGMAGTSTVSRAVQMKYQPSTGVYEIAGTR